MQLSVKAGEAKGPVNSPGSRRSFGRLDLSEASPKLRGFFAGFDLSLSFLFQFLTQKTHLEGECFGPSYLRGFFSKRIRMWPWQQSTGMSKPNFVREDSGRNRQFTKSLKSFGGG